MPIKLPKGFPRRKSSGNALEENPNPPQPSFRVFERQPDGRKSFDGGNALKRMTEPRPMSDGQYREYEQGKLGGLNRGSGGTQNSGSTSGLYDTSSSARFSSSSTLPSSSSLDATTPDDLSHAHPKPPQKVATPSGFSVRAAGRTFSFGARKSIQVPVASPDEIPLPQQHANYSDIPSVHPAMRPRAMTELSHASGSTATPPKLLDTDFGDDGGEGFGDIFAGLAAEKRRSRIETQQATNQDNPPINLKTPNHPGQSLPMPILLDRTGNVSPAPFTGTSQNSRDGLISASPQQDFSPFDRQPPKPSFVNSSRTRSTPTAMSPSNVDNPLFLDPRSQQQWKGQGERSPDFLNEDTRLAMQYMGASEPSSRTSHKKSTASITRKNIPNISHPRPVTLYDGENQDNQESELSRSDSISTTPRAKKASLSKDDDRIIDDLDFQAMAISANRYQTQSESPPPLRPPPPKTQGKVMTPAQFERYKKEQDSLRNQYASNKSDSEEEDIDKYEDDDEEERNKEMARQRRKQDAQMSVYRQQMMKVTGEQPPISSALQRSTMTSTNGLNDRFNDSKDDDEDEDVPLGILAAHGFPSKERPPSHLNRMGSQPNIRYTSETYPPPPASASGVSVRDSSGNMPAFARNLPKDPFFGAGLVNATDRQPLAFGAGSQSVYGGSQTGASNHGGLVGVIAKEERARALRRGSPNAATFDLPNVAPPPHSPNVAGASQSQDHQAQMHMSQQMTQMMQMQMQWMQQMMALQGQQMMPGPNMMPQMPQMPGFQLPQVNISASNDSTLPRPTSTGNMANTGTAPPPLGPRAMSMLTPDPHTWNSRNGRNSGAPFAMGSAGRHSAMSQNSFTGTHGGPQHGDGYAPSLAPSERSNVGLAPRYRPVSTVPGADSNGRTSTMGSSGLNAWERQGKGKAAATVRVVPAKKRDDEEDEDEGWEEMRKKREKKRTLWRGKKADKADQNALEGVFYPHMD